MNLQETFDTVYIHLLTQNEKSMAPFPFPNTVEVGALTCSYRGKNGTKCAVGCLIKDEFYNSSFEGKFSYAPVVSDALENSGVDMSVQGMHTMLLDLQEVHDNSSIGLWKGALANVAFKYNLTIPNMP